MGTAGWQVASSRDIGLFISVSGTQTTHLGCEELIWKYFLIPQLSSRCKMESQNYSACSQVNAAPGYKQESPGIQLKGTLPFEHLEVDFTEMRPYWYYHYY